MCSDLWVWNTSFTAAAKVHPVSETKEAEIASHWPSQQTEFLLHLLSRDLMIYDAFYKSHQGACIIDEPLDSTVVRLQISLMLALAATSLRHDPQLKHIQKLVYLPCYFCVYGDKQKWFSVQTRKWKRNLETKQSDIRHVCRLYFRGIFVRQ